MIALQSTLCRAFPLPSCFKFQFIVQLKTFPLGGRCPRKGADEGKE